MGISHLAVPVLLLTLLAGCGGEGLIPPNKLSSNPAPTAAKVAPIAPAAGIPVPASPASPPPRSATAPPVPVPAGPMPPEGSLPSEDEVKSLYEGVMLTYSFDACGLPLLGSVARQDIAHRIEVCPNPQSRKTAFRTVYQRAISDAESDPVKTHANALALCPDKRAFLQNVMAHSGQLRFDDSKPPDCGLLGPHP